MEYWRYFKQGDEIDPLWLQEPKIDAFTEQQRVIEKVMAENAQLRAENTVLVEALQKIASYNTLNGDKYNSYEWGWHGVAEFAGKALANTSEQAKALLAVVDTLRELIESRHYVMPWASLHEALAAYDKLKES